MTPEQAIAMAKARKRAAESAKGANIDTSSVKVIATTSDGGRIMEGPDGKRSFASPGYSTTDPESIARIMEGATPKDLVGESLDKQIIDAAPGGVLGGAVAKAGQGMPFVGQWLDEGLEAAGVDPRGLRQLQGAMDRRHPKTSLASEVTGGVVGSAPFAFAGASKAMDAATKTGRVVMGGLMGGAFGAAEGAASGAGRRNDGARMDGALTGGGLGGGMGLALGVAAPLAGDAIGGLVRRVKKLDVRTIANEFGISPSAAATVKAALANDDLDKAAKRLAALGDDSMLADAGDATSQLLDASAQSGGKALRVTREAVEGRATAAGARLGGKLDAILGPADGIKAASRGIAQRTAKARSAAYDAAWRAPIDYSTGAKGEAVLDALERVPDEFMSAAIKTANRRAKMQGDDLFQPIMASIDDAGRVTFSELPSVRQLHELKISLNNIVEDGTDAVTGKLTPDARDAKDVAAALRNALVDASPAYKAASKLGGDKIAEDAALDIGRKLLRPQTTFEDVLGVMRGASQEARLAARRGLREHIEQTLSNVRRTITDGDTDAREAMKLVSELSSRANLKKARLVLGTDAKALLDELEKAEAALALRAATSRNSATAIRTSIQGQAKDELQPSLLRRVAGKGGNPLEAASQITEEIAGIDPRTMSRAEQAMFAEIAEALTGIRGQDAHRALFAVKSAMAGQPLKDAQSELIGRAVAASVFGLGNPAASQIR